MDRQEATIKRLDGLEERQRHMDPNIAEIKEAMKSSCRIKTNAQKNSRTIMEKCNDLLPLIGVIGE